MIHITFFFILLFFFFFFFLQKQLTSLVMSALYHGGAFLASMTSPNLLLVQALLDRCGRRRFSRSYRPFSIQEAMLCRHVARDVMRSRPSTLTSMKLTEVKNLADLLFPLFHCLEWKRNRESAQEEVRYEVANLDLFLRRATAVDELRPYADKNLGRLLVRSVQAELVGRFNVDHIEWPRVLLRRRPIGFVFVFCFCFFLFCLFFPFLFVLFFFSFFFFPLKNNFFHSSFFPPASFPSFFPFLFLFSFLSQLLTTYYAPLPLLDLLLPLLDLPLPLLDLPSPSPSMSITEMSEINQS